MVVNYSDEEVQKGKKSIFLAGPTARKEEDGSWRLEAIQKLKEYGFDGIVYTPEYSSWKPKESYLDQAEWERSTLKEATVIVFWIPRELEKMPAFTTNVEFGYWLSSGKVVYGRPNGAPKTKYLDWLYQKDYHKAPYSTLEETLKEAIILSNSLETIEAFREPIISLVSHKKVPTLTGYETKIEKARAIITTPKNTVFVTEMKDCFLLPGGTCEKEENPNDTIVREVKEELGIKVPLKPLVCVEYYHEGFSKYQGGGVERRLNRVYYYYGKAKTLGEEKLTEYEKSHQFQRRECTLEEIYQQLGKKSKNAYKKFADRELFFVLEYAKDKEIL